MKRLVILLFLISAYQLKAQKNLDGLIRAEKSFAAYSVAHGTKDAFLKFADSNAIVFEGGKPVNAIEVWNKREKRPSVLNWRPQFIEIAFSKDFGYTTGPWELRPGANSDSVMARGQFVTIWHLDKKGEWKFLVDLGVNNTPKVLTTDLQEIKAGKLKGEAITDQVLEAEQHFIEIYKQGKIKAYQAFLSGQSILNRNGLNYPATTRESQSQFIINTPSDIEFTISGSGIASSGDLAYVYGNTISNTKQENYLHIWRKEKHGWKIALEVLRY